MWIDEYGSYSIYAACWIFMVTNAWPSPLLQKLVCTIVIDLLLILLEAMINDNETSSYTYAFIGMLSAGSISSALGTSIMITMCGDGEVPHPEITKIKNSHAKSEKTRKYAKSMSRGWTHLPSHIDYHLEAEIMFGGYQLVFGEYLIMMMTSAVILSWDTGSDIGEKSSSFPLIFSCLISSIGAMMIMSPFNLNFAFACTGNILGTIILIAVNSSDPATILEIGSTTSAGCYWILCGLYALWVYADHPTLSRTKLFT